MAKSLNKVTLIGNLTRDPELRFTPSGTAVCTFSVATNRQWKTESGEMKDEAEYHRIVAWDKLGEICNQMLKKGKKVFVEGRLQTRKWQAQDGSEKSTTEIVISDMIYLDSRGAAEGGSGTNLDDIDKDFGEAAPVAESAQKKTVKKEEEESDDIPF